MSRYNNNYFNRAVKLDTENNRRYYEPILDPIIPKDETDYYILASFGERLDSLAFKYYGDASLWWIIAAANPELRKDSLFLEPGVQVRVPENYSIILQSLTKLNKSR